MSEFQNLIVWVSGLIAIISLISTIWSFVSSGSRSNAKKINEHDQSIAAVKLRLQSLETEIKAKPAVNDMHRLEVMLAEMGGDMKAMRATMKGMSESMTRIDNVVGRHEEHLRETP